MKTAIIYYSFSGNNKLLAETLADRLSADLIRITEPYKRGAWRILWDMLFCRTPKINPVELNYEDYDHVMIMAPIWDFRIANPMKTFLKKYGPKLREYSFITLCIGRKGQEEVIHNQLEEWTHKAPMTMVEFKINDLVAPQQQDKLQHVTGYEVRPREIARFEPQIKALVELIKCKEMIAA